MLQRLLSNATKRNILFYFIEMAFIAPETKRALERLSHMPDVNVIVISGREMTDLKKKVRIASKKSLV